MLAKYLSDPSQSHWKATKNVLRYLQGTKDLMLTYQRTDTLEVELYVERCQADTYNFLYYGGRVCGVL